MKSSTRTLLLLAFLLLTVAASLTDDEIVNLHGPLLSADALKTLKRGLRGGGMIMHQHGNGGGDEVGCGCHCHMGLTQQEYDVVMQLFRNRHGIERTPVAVPGGFNITTVAPDDPVTASLIQGHVHSMTHLDASRRVRQCDPLYRALREHRNETSIRVEYVKDRGVHVTHVGRTPCAAALVRDHTRTVSGFVDTGDMWPDRGWTAPEECRVASSKEAAREDN